MQNDVLYLNNKLDNTIVDTIKLLKIDTTYRISSTTKFIIKCFKINEEFDEKNSEIFLIEKYLMNEFSHNNYLNYYAIIKINKNYNITNDKDDSLTKLTIYKNKISPMLNSIENKSKDKYDNIAVVMPHYEKLSDYLNDNDITINILLENIIGILDLSILIRDKYNYIHPDVKLCNIVVDNNKFYLIDWEDAYLTKDTYYNQFRPTDGNTEMYPYYDATAEQFLIHSIGVLIVRIIGYHFEITYKDFMENYSIHYILTKIPNKNLRPYEHLILDIFSRKFNKIEELINSINKLLELKSKDGQPV